jgi:hypothetical protein
MKRSLAVFVVWAAATLLASVPAAAKEVTDATVCGSNECAEAEDSSLIQPIVEGRGPTDPPDHPSGWFRTTVTVAGEGGASDRFSFAAFPRDRLIRGEDGAWMAMSARTARVYRRLVRGIEPLPALRLPASAAAPPVAEPEPEPAAEPDPAAAEEASTPLWQSAVAAALLAALALAAFPRVRRGLAAVARRRPADAG